MLDDKLINKIKERKNEGLDMLIDEYGKLCYGVISSVLAPNNMNESIDECFDDVLITVWYKIELFEAVKGSLRNWIISVCKFKALDYLRKKRENLEINNEKIEDEINIENHIIKEEEKEELLKAIEKLGDMDRDIFKLRFIEERDIEYISNKLGIEKGSIYTRISRGKTKLRKLMEGYYE
ncbi:MULTISPECIES: sigma-70 family RNA polymerase sigma factor [unclassified Clostridium]|uniref:RNA polymerase sigma-70 factor n=2 Tax=Clostridium TaxID=1485 RepID=B2TLH8_CLOBB|nr:MULTISPECIES: sigma-70 family RNA polymerase sigma factor [unclassified Clostridium]ACD23016.1 RNA polymerase sigma-70 factor [Clostridium botulinum B str. Eklund 17B (NRP)]MBN1052402.1 RNA polymerase subunit sigma-24 [Clostridium botulinum]MBN1055521.1 RNA polymerase subunit sigma-24 [Clostridium botulinum]MBY6976976.1 sigma-70 family RNA polymerase sigma factor [Clostridium botulinum]MBY6999133.1 sigma-70 family RNA polymerase sigma factor [Clostridium botulinum]